MGEMLSVLQVCRRERVLEMMALFRHLAATYSCLPPNYHPLTSLMDIFCDSMGVISEGPPD
jgi:hypothetical protein